MPLGLGASLGIGGGRSATSSGAPSGGSTPFDEYSISLDGTDDVLTIATSTDFSFGTGDFTTSIWFKLAVSPSGLYRCIYDFRTGGSVYAPTLYTSNVSGYRLYAWNGSSAVNYNTLLSSGQWYHVAYVREGTTGTIYLDGSSVASGTDSRNYTLASPLPRLGGPPGGVSASYFNGLLDEFSVFDSALSSSDITAIYNSGTPTDLTSLSPVGWWRMGDGTESASGTTIYDMSANSNNGTLENGPTYSTDVPS